MMTAIKSMIVDPAVIKALLRGACPERVGDLDALWLECQPLFSVLPDQKGITFFAAKREVVWDYKSVAHNWLMVHAAWHAYFAYQPVVRVCQAFGTGLHPEFLGGSHDLTAIEDEIGEILYAALCLRQSDDVENFLWPSKVNPPTSERTDLPTVQGKFIFDIAALSLSAWFLHELKHVKFFVNKNAPKSLEDEERQCDCFSRQFLMERFGEYARSSGDSPALVQTKRVMGLGTAAFILGEITPRDMASTVSDPHPDLSIRFEEMVFNVAAPENDLCWEYVASLLIATVKRLRGIHTPIDFSSTKDLCKKLVALL